MGDLFVQTKKKRISDLCSEGCGKTKKENTSNEPKGGFYVWRIEIALWAAKRVLFFFISALVRDRKKEFGNFGGDRGFFRLVSRRTESGLGLGLGLG